MKGKRLAAFALAFVVLGTGLVYASSPWGEYNGYTKVKVVVNNQEVTAGTVPAFIIDGRAVLPLRSVADSLQAMVKWDDANKTAYIYKPNIHMFVAQGTDKNDSLRSPFGRVKQSKKMDFVVAAQADSLETPIHSFKIELLSPDGTLLRSTDPVMLDGKDSFWYSWPVEGLTFEASGDYKVRFLIKMDEIESYTTVSEKIIVSE